MSPYAVMAGTLTGLLSSLAARFLPGFGFQPIKPTRITPVYFPAWFIDAEAQVEVSYRDTQVEY